MKRCWWQVPCQWPQASLQFFNGNAEGSGHPSLPPVGKGLRQLRLGLWHWLWLWLWGLLGCPPSQCGLHHRLLTPLHPSTCSFSLCCRIFPCVQTNLLLLYFMFFARFFGLCLLPLMMLLLLLLLPLDFLIDNNGFCALCICYRLLSFSNPFLRSLKLLYLYTILITGRDHFN